MSSSDRRNFTELGRARLDEIVTAERRTQLNVDAIEDYARKVQELQDSLPRKGVRQPIEAGLGTVVVDGQGRLRDIQLDISRVNATDADVIGEKIRQSIIAAEAKVASFREGQLKALSTASRISE